MNYWSMQNNEKKEKTIIIISHRLSTLKYCDRVLEIKNGKIIEKF